MKKIIRIGFYAFAENLCKDLRSAGMERTAERYLTAIKSFRCYFGTKDFPLKRFDTTLVMGYEAFLKGKTLCPNTFSFYLRNLRAIYNRAVDEGLCLQNFPFKRVYTGIGETSKRAVSSEVIRMIRDYDVGGNPAFGFARDMFMLSFYLRGIAFVDLAFLNKSDLHSGIVSYRRRKTGQKLCVKWERQMQEILNRYEKVSGKYLLPIISENDADEWRQYKTASHRVNMNLRHLGELLGLDSPLTFYVARHNWASVARDRKIAISVISEAMGHDSEATTRIYLASLDKEIVDRANSIVINSI